MNALKIGQKDRVHARQVAFFAAFILPLGKFLETPSLLARDAKGDILLPALLQFLTQTLVLLGVLYAASRSKKSLAERLGALGKWAYLLYGLYAVYFLFAATLPLLDLEKFVYAAFFDTAPTSFSFGIFFLFAAFVCAKGLKSLARAADLCLFLFLLPFFALIVMACFETDLTRLLPFFGTELSGSLNGFTKSTPHFSDVALLLPLVANLKYEEGDGVKITLGYAAGAAMTLLFFAVFFGVFSSLAPREHYAFSKIAQYFPALDVIGRVDLIFVYLLSVVLLLYTCAPLAYAAELTAKLFQREQKSIFAAAVSLLSFLFVLFNNRFYNSIYAFFTTDLLPFFWFVAYLLPLFLLFLPTERKENALA